MPQILQTAPIDSTYKTNRIAKVAVFGLPNAGKSSLLNRVSSFEIPNYKKAVVAKEAGTTRDINLGEVEWGGYFFSIADTGGLVPDTDEKITKAIQIKTWAALASADLLIWLIDKRQDPQTISEKILSKVWKLNKPYIVAINKVDDPNQDTSVADYAFLGGVGFVNLSCNTGYGLGDLMDLVVNQLSKLGFKPNTQPLEYEIKDKIQGKKGKKKLVEKALDGNYYITRNQDGLFESFSSEVSQIQNLPSENANLIETFIFDLTGVIFGYQLEEFQLWLKQQLNFEINWHNQVLNSPLNLPVMVNNLNKDVYNQQELEQISVLIQKYKSLKTQPNPLFEYKFPYQDQQPINSRVLNFLINQKKLNRKVLYLTNAKVLPLKKEYPQLFDLFDGGIAADNQNYNSSLIKAKPLIKPDPEIFFALQDKYQLDVTKSCFIDDNSDNIAIAKELGYKTIHYQGLQTNLEIELASIEKHSLEYPKILFLGRPNVGKSSLFNALAGEDIQIVTDIAGTTLGVKDILIEKVKKADYKTEKIKHLVFDFDGVLADSLEANYYAIQEIYKIDRSSAIKQTLEWAQQTPKWGKQTTKVEHNRELKKIKAYLDYANKQSIPLFEEFIEQINQIENSKLAVVSSASEFYIKEKLEQSQANFEIILGAEHHHSKIEKIEHLCQSWDCSPDDILYFTDTPRDYLELKQIIPTQNIFGCAWGWVGKELLEKYLDKNQILIEFKDVHKCVNQFNFTSQISYINYQKFQILDSAGIRKTGQRALGAETFATYHTIEAAHKADVILLVLDGSTPPTHQDQVVAGIAQEAKKGIVVVINKADLLNSEQKSAYIKKLQSKFQFLKAGRVIWVSAKTGQGLNQIIDTINLSLADRQKILSKEEVRKLFNYLMKQKPPNKLKLQKRAIIYDLIYTSTNPPTFELLVKKKKTLHWSYLRFLENVIRKNFGFENTEIKVKTTEVDRKMIN